MSQKWELHTKDAYVKAPPTSGPTTAASAKVADSELVMAGLRRGRAERAMMMKQPANVPAMPTPVMARPAMKASLFGASANKTQYSFISSDNLRRRKGI